MTSIPTNIEFVTTTPLSSFRFLHSTKDTEWQSSLQKYRDEVESEHPLQIRLKRLLSCRLPSSKCHYNQSSTTIREDDEVRAKAYDDDKEQIQSVPKSGRLYDYKLTQEQSSNHRKLLLDKCISKRMNHLAVNVHMARCA